MCEFASWIEFKGETYFIDDDKLNTKEGRELIQYCKNRDDLRGHGAIRHYYPELKEQGTERECTDFSTPSNFPKEIVNAIKKGKFRETGIVLDILNAEGIAEYNKIIQSAFWDIAKQSKYRIKAWK